MLKLSTSVTAQRIPDDGGPMNTDRFYKKTYDLQNGSDHSPVTLFDLTNTAAGLSPLSTVFALKDFESDGIDIDFYQEDNCPVDIHYDDVLAWVAAMAGESPTASALWKRASNNGWSIAIADLKGQNFHLEMDSKQLYLDQHGLSAEALMRSTYFRCAFLCIFVRAMRAIWHEENLVMPEKIYKSEDVLMLERIRAADCETVVILTGWEWRGIGSVDIWRYLLGSEESDMATTMQNGLEKDPIGQFDRTVLAKVFRKWYENENRVNACDHDTLESFDEFLHSEETHNPFGSKNLTAREIETQMALPDGVEYIRGYGQAILEDPFFAGLHDQFNQAHFFHIMYDLEVVVVNNVPFRDSKLARKIFPHDGTQ